MKKICNFKQNKLSKSLGTIGLAMFLMANKVNAAEVVTEVQGGGQIQSSKLGQGLLNMVRDVTGTIQWILPIVRSVFHIILCI